MVTRLSRLLQFNAAPVGGRSRPHLRNPSYPQWLTPVSQTLDRLLAGTIALVFPPRCVACGREEFADRARTAIRPRLCALCRDAVAPADGNRCRRCAAPVGPYVETTSGCMHCARDRFQFQSVVRLGVYKSLLRQLCRRAKQAGGLEHAAALSELLWEREAEALRGARPDVVVPVPHHWVENWQPTPHASETIATVLARHLRAELGTHILAKVRRTPKQSGLPPSRRRLNLRGAFHVPRRARSRVADRRILLVDDILTTGATANEAARALVNAGAASVVVAVVARGLGAKPGAVPIG